MDLQNISISEVRHRKTYTIWYHLHVESKNNANESIHRTERNLVIKGEMEGGRDKVGVWD